MMGLLWVVLFVALTGTHLGYGLPVRPTPQAYPHDASTANAYEGWGSEGAYAAVPALALVLTAVGLLFGCTWCYRHKDCKPNEGADNQLFTASAAHLHEARRSQPPDSGFSEPANNNISEDNNNGPISLREMQNIANNNAAAYIVSENEERNRVSRESVVEFEPLPTGIRVADPLEHCADWFGVEDFSRNRLQYLREIGRGWFGRVVEGEVDDAGTASPVAVKILNQNASLEDKARFLDESKMYRDVRHENILAFVGKCLQEDPWILIFEFCPMDLQQYLVLNRPKMAILNESGVPLRLMCDVTGALAYLHSRGYLYGNVCSGGVLVRGTAENARGVLGRYAVQEQNDAAESRAHGAQTSSTSISAEVWCVGTLVWEVCAWGAAPPVAPAAPAAAAPADTPPPPDLPCPYRSHLYQVMQLCWHPNPECRPTSAQVHALINHLYVTHTDASDVSHDDGYGSTDFEERWQRLKPNTIPKIDEHVAIVHAPSTSMASHFTGSDQEFDNAPTISQCQDTLSVDMDTAVSRSSSIMSDKDPLSVQLKSESLTNLHGSLEDVRNIYLTHNEMAVLECHQGNISLDESRDKEQDRSDSSMDPWLKDIIAGSHDDVSYYKDVSDVIKNLDNILNSEKTSSSESSHQASPSRDNLSLDCKKDYPMPSCMVKSPGINNFQHILESGFAAKSEDEPCEDEDTDRDTIGTLSHSFERHSDTVSQHTLENLTPDTPNKDIETVYNIEDLVGLPKSVEEKFELDKESAKSVQHDKLPKGIDIVSSDSEIPKLKELCVSSINSVSETSIEQLNVIKDCQTPCDNNFTEIRTDIKEETKSIDDIGKPNVDSEPLEDVGKIDTVGKLQKEKRIIVEEVLPESVNEITGNNNVIGALPIIETTINVTKLNEISDIEPEVNHENIPLPPESIESSIKYINDPLMHDDLIEMRTNCSLEAFNEMASEVNVAEEKLDVERKAAEKPDVENVSTSHMTPDSVQNIIDREKSRDTNNILEEKETEMVMVVSSEESLPPQVMPPDIVQNKKENTIKSETEKANDLKEYGNKKEDNILHRSETEELIETKDQILTPNSTVYMDLISNTNSDIFNHTISDNSNEALEDHTIDSNIKHVIQSCLESAPTENNCSIVNNESTVYLDLPSFVVKKETDNFLHMEKIKSSSPAADNIFASTPKGSDSSSENQHELTLENSVNDNETQNFSVIENLFKDNKIQALSDLEDSVEWNKIQDMSEIGTLVKGNETKVLSEIENLAKENETQVLSETETSVKQNETQVLLGIQRSIADKESIVFAENKNSDKDNETQVISEIENSVKDNETQLIQKSITDNETIVLSEIDNSIKDKEKKALSEIDNLKNNETQILSKFENSVNENETKVLSKNETLVKVNETQVLSGIQSSFVDNESIAFSGTENSVKDNENQVQSRNENSEKDNESQVLPEFETSVKMNETQVLSGIQSSFVDNELIAFSGTENSVKDNENQVQSRNENSEKDNESQVLPEFETSVKMNKTQVLSGIQSSFVDNESIAFSGTENSVKDNENQVLSRNENTIKENETQMLSNIEHSEKENETRVLLEFETSAKTNETQVLSEIENSFKENETQVLSIENSVKFNVTQVLPEKKNESQILTGIEKLVNDYETRVLSGIEKSTKENEPQVLMDIKNSVKNECDESQEKRIKENEVLVLSEFKVPDYGPGVTVTKLEQRYVPDSMSPFESPTKSHHTDTYDENSSVVLGPFENCSLELFKGIKSSVDNIDIPKEELLAFSSNFSEMNLATPSPLRDGNFLNEVPDIILDDVQFDDIEVISEVRTDPSEPLSDDTEQSATEKHVSPSTPPNSPGIFLASTSQQKYLVDIDLNSEQMPQDPDFNLQKEIELNQIELQITSKLAMAENENNLNIEYSGPLTVEGLVEEGVLMRESDPIPESYLAGNGGSLEDLRENLSLDEECVKALRNELELKLPLAQVAAIEPPLELETDADSDSEAPETWAPAPPELIVSYPPALSPIAEETRQQLSAYENDINWNTSARTESSESYPEPCNNSTDDVTELPTAAQDQSTYTLPSKEHSPHNTYTVQKEIMSSKEITMSADSLNASPFRKPIIDHQSPVDDTTYNKNDDEKESNCERISQVSPFLLSPTTETSAPDNSDNFDNATGVSTLSKTTLPTDAKLSKPSETQCLSKATSIDSWCSNDTLYNVEENFDDLAMDPDVPIDFEPEKEEGGSESTDTLTHNDDEKELSHCSTYIIHDSKSDVCETFSPDSITANDNYTYTKVKTEAAATPLLLNKSEQNDSTKTKDLAYGTLTSGQPSYSTCATEIASKMDDVWKLQQPELVRRSPVPDDINITPPKFVENKVILDESSPKLASEPCIKKMDSVEMPCLQDDSVEESKIIETEVSSIEVVNSPESNYRHMTPSLTSTPLTEVPTDTDIVEGIPMNLPEIKTESPECSMKVSNFTSFQLSAEVRPQDLCSDMSNECTNHDTEQLLEGESKTLSRNSNIDSMIVSETTPTYSDFECSATTKPQDVQSKSSQSLENGVSSEGFRQFENSARNRPQDLSSVIDASCLLLNSERMSSDFAMTSSTISNEPTKLEVSPPNISNLIESHLVNIREPSNMFLINVDEEEETEQPHSIIITESPIDAFKESPNKTYDSHAEVKLIDLNFTYDSHRESAPNTQQSLVNNSGENIQLKINGANEQEVNFIDSTENNSPKAETSNFVKEEINTTNVSDTENITNRSLSEANADNDDIKCNGSSEKFAIVNFLSETFEELIESNVDDSDTKDAKVNDEQVNQDETLEMTSPNDVTLDVEAVPEEEITSNGVKESEDGKITSVTEDFLQNEKEFCQIDYYLPLLSDIRFTGPATEIMSTSFTQDSPTEATSPECEQCEQEAKPNIAAEIAKEWDSDSDTHSSNSSSGEFIWKDGDGHETSVVPSTHFDHQRGNGPQPDGADNGDRGASEGGVASDGSGDSGSGSEGDEVEFVPSSWDCRAAPSKSSLRSLEAQADNKKRVVFKRQKYHCVYEYPREVADLDAHSPAYLPDLSTYSEWSPSSMEEAELGYGQLFSSAPSLDLYPIPAGIAFGADYDEDFFISSSARPFESLGIMSTTSQFFPGMHIKNSLLERDIADDINEDFPPPPSPLPPTTTTTTTTLLPTRTPSLDFTTPDSGVEDITPVSTIDDEFKAKKLSETELTWRPVDSASSSESVSPSSPGGEALGGLRHTRDKLKLDLPPSPHITPSPRHNRVFNFVLDKPKRRSQEERPVETGTTPLVMSDETPIVTNTLPLPKDCEELPAPEPTFSTFGKSVQKPEPEQKAIILTDEIQDGEPEVKDESPKVVEAVKGEGTVLDSGDEDSGIESSSKATLERNKTPNVS